VGSQRRAIRQLHHRCTGMHMNCLSVSCLQLLLWQLVITWAASRIMSRTVCDVCPPELTYLTPTPARRRYGRVGYFAVQHGCMCVCTARKIFGTTRQRVIVGQVHCFVLWGSVCLWFNERRHCTSMASWVRNHPPRCFSQHCMRGPVLQFLFSSCGDPLAKCKRQWQTSP
jgi:hypothetical protein